MDGQETEDLLEQDMKNMKTMQQSEYYQNQDKEIKDKQNYTSVQNIKRILDYQDYQQYLKERNEKAKKEIIVLTSEQLKEDYKITKNYLYLNLKKLIIVSILSAIFSIVCFRYFGASNNLAWLTSSNVTSLILCIFLVTFLYLGCLIDIYNHKVFYVISMIEAFNIICSLFLNFMNIYISYDKLTCKGTRCRRIKAPPKVITSILISFNVLSILGYLLNLKFAYALFVEGFNVFTKREKTIVQKQLDINERKRKMDEPHKNEKKEDKKEDKKEEKKADKKEDKKADKKEDKKESKKNKKKHKN